jgi:hypothetical protein
MLEERGERHLILVIKVSGTIRNIYWVLTGTIADKMNVNDEFLVIECFPFSLQLTHFVRGFIFSVAMASESSEYRINIGVDSCYRCLPSLHPRSVAWNYSSRCPKNAAVSLTYEGLQVF